MCVCVCVCVCVSFDSFCGNIWTTTAHHLIGGIRPFRLNVCRTHLHNISGNGSITVSSIWTAEGLSLNDIVNGHLLVDTANEQVR